MEIPVDVHGRDIPHLAGMPHLDDWVMVPLPGIVPSPLPKSYPPSLEMLPHSLDYRSPLLWTWDAHVCINHLATVCKKIPRSWVPADLKPRWLQKVAEQGWDKIKPWIKFALRYHASRASLVSQMVKNLPAMPETQVWSIGQEDPLEKENGNPLVYSCLENSMDREAWWAAAYGVVKSQKLLSNWANMHALFIHMSWLL